MQALQDITTKNLHDETGKFVRAAQAGQKFRVSIDGAPGAIIIPDESTQDASWDEIMATVRARRAQAKQPKSNPIIAERKKRNYAAHLR